MTPETKLRTAIVRYLQKLRSSGSAVWWCKIVRADRAGVPDLLVVWYGYTVLLELKAAGGRVSRLQEHELRRAEQAGAVARVVRSVEDVKRALGIEIQARQGEL
jgi:hypothetical protein